MVIGVDFGARRHSVCMLDEAGKVMRQLEVAHSGRALYELLTELKATAQGEPVRVGLERPDGALVDLLQGLELEVFAINPKQVDHWRQFVTGSAAKDDRRDAFVIADALRRKPEAFRRVGAPSPATLKLRQLLSVRDDVTKQKTATLNQLNAMLQPVLPTLLARLDPQTQWGLRVLKALLRLSQPERVRRSTLAKAMMRARRLRPAGVVEALRTDRALRAEGRWAAVAPMAQVYLDQLELFIDQLERIEADLSEALDAFESEAGETAARDLAVIRSMPGAGQQLAAVLAVFGWDAVQRRDRERIRRLGGVAPVTLQTGGRRCPRRSEVRQRKACNHLLREALHHWGRIAAQFDPFAKARLAELRSRGHTFGRAIRQLVDGLLRVLFAALEDAALYTPKAPTT